MADGEKQYIQLPDGSYGEFPAEMKDEEIRAAIDKEYKPTAMQSAGRFVRSVPGALKEMAGEAWKSATMPSAPTAEGKQTEPTLGEKAKRVLGLEEGALFGGSGEAGGIAGGGYRPEDPATPFIFGAGEAAMPVVGAAARKYMPATTAAARRLFGAGERAAEGGAATATLPKTEPAAAPPAAAPRAPGATAESQLDASAQKLFGKRYGELNHEQQIMAARGLHEAGTAGGPAEQRTLRGTAPTMERRSMEMAKPTITPPGAAPAFKIETDPKMGIRWAKTPGLPDISIPPRMTDPGQIAQYVAEKQALQRQGMATLPKTTIASPGPPAAQPGAPGAMPQISKGGISAAGTEAATRPSSPADRAQALRVETDDIQQRLRSGQGSPAERAQAESRLAENQRMIQELGAGTLPPVTTGPPAAPPPTTLGKPAPEPGAPRTLNEAVDQAVGLKKK